MVLRALDAGRRMEPIAQDGRHHDIVGGCGGLAERQGDADD